MANPNPGHKPDRNDAAQALGRTVEVFDREFPRRDGRKYSVVTDAMLEFDKLVAANDGDGLALFMETPTQLIMSVLFSINTRLKDIESTLISLSNRVDALEHKAVAPAKV